MHGPHETHSWIINASLAASGTTHPTLAARARFEAPAMRRVAEELAGRAWLMPWVAQPMDALVPNARLAAISQ